LAARPEVADACAPGPGKPRILRNQDGIEVLKAPRMGEAQLAEAFDDVDFHLGRMDRQGVEVSVLSLLARSAGSRLSRWTCPGRCAGASTTGFPRFARNIPAASPPSPHCP